LILGYELARQQQLVQLARSLDCHLRTHLIRLEERHPHGERLASFIGGGRSD
jgi:hypothetical protein